ncbi:T9SS type A sorting domain-containing protein [Tenacibaculum amylolyticum]|uniref:T9SS type A sorting domain-containing protein n=1 Tax=Tenacibaculum amylolyticum TaxID=104269 RepID=UPI0038B5BE5F
MKVLKITGLNIGVKKMVVFDIEGKEIVSFSLKGKKITEIKLPPLKSGAYIIRLKTTDGASIRREIMIE